MWAVTKKKKKIIYAYKIADIIIGKSKQTQTTRRTAGRTQKMIN